MYPIYNSDVAMHLIDFFAQYPKFSYDPSNGVMQEFWRLCNNNGWKKNDRMREDARDALRDAIAQQFNAIYGTDLDSIDSWHTLCNVVGIDPTPDTPEKCRTVCKPTVHPTKVQADEKSVQAVEKIYVNIVDLVDAPNTGEPVHVFATELQLSAYTKATGKYYPEENAMAGGLLRFLLRHIISPRTEPKRRMTSRKRRRR